MTDWRLYSHRVDENKANTQVRALKTDGFRAAKRLQSDGTWAVFVADAKRVTVTRAK